MSERRKHGRHHPGRITRTAARSQNTNPSRSTADARIGDASVSDSGVVDNIVLPFTSLNIHRPRPTSTQHLNGHESASPSVTSITQTSNVANLRRVAISDHDVEQYIQRVVNLITPSEVELNAKRNICSRIEPIVWKIFPNAKLKIMGGVANTFALKDSDLDLCLVETNVAPSSANFTLKVEQLDLELRKAGYRTQLLLHTFVPLLKLDARSPGSWETTRVEISWTDQIGLCKTALLAEYSKIDARVRPFVIFIKYWSKMRKLTDTQHGGLGSYAWCLLCIYFLMKVTKPPLVPNLQTKYKPYYIQDCDVSFSLDTVFLRNSKETLAALVKEFFKFFAAFEFENLVVSIRPSVDPYITKASKGWSNVLARGFGRSGQRVRHSYYIAVEDPFEITCNAGRTLDYITYLKIKAEFKRAVQILSGEKAGREYVPLSHLCQM